MSILSGQPCRVSPADPADPAEVQALRDVLRRDEPYPDECPEADDFQPPSDADSLWWSIETEPEAAGDPDPILTLSGSWDLPNGQYGYRREEP